MAKIELSRFESLVQILESFQPKYRLDDVFDDFVVSMAGALSLDNEQRQYLERRYERIVNKYARKDLEKLSEGFALLVDLFEDNIKDYLGELFMTIRSNGKKIGQFFTPYHISELCASLDDCLHEDETYGYVTLCEPSVGSGGAVLAKAKWLKDHGKNPQKVLKITAFDVDERCVLMAFVQFSILGLDAVVNHADTLTGDFTRAFQTVTHLGGIV